MTTLSVVVPCLDDAHLLRGCLSALACQSRLPDEVLVVDNGSTDDTAAVAEAAGARVVREPARGVLHATSTGFDAATCDIIGRLDADSRPAPDWAARVVERFDADPALTAVTGTGRFYGRSAPWRILGQFLYLGVGYFGIVRLVTGRTPLFGSNVALRRDAWLAVRDHVHLDDPRVHDDLDLTFALDPDMVSRYDRRLHVAVSARPFDTAAGFRRRASWGFHTIGVNLADITWANRLARLAAARAARRAGSPRRRR